MLNHQINKYHLVRIYFAYKNILQNGSFQKIKTVMKLRDMNLQDGLKSENEKIV